MIENEARRPVNPDARNRSSYKLLRNSIKLSSSHQGEHDRSCL